MANFGSSAAIVWPAALGRIPFYEAVDYRVINFQEAAKGMMTPMMLPISSWKNINAIPLAWRSLAWFKMHCPLPPSSWHGEVRAVVKLSDETSLSKLAAMHGFWSLDHKQLRGWPHT
mmetsp:Transcript_34069/g.96763  ORF Transcript_34069/g.96763 Transcript_34069/m.96763 type:complete len:117 (-) Transcript_34069:22-372(-)